MSIGKNSISRLSKTATAEGGIRSLAPEVPVGDAATPAPFAIDAMTEAAPEAPAAQAEAPKKKPGRKPKAQTAVAEKETPATVAPKKRGRKPSNAKTDAKATPAKKTAAKAPAPKAAPKATAPKAAAKTKNGFVTVQVGEAMPYWLL